MTFQGQFQSSLNNPNVRPPPQQFASGPADPRLTLPGVASHTVRLNVPQHQNQPPNKPNFSNPMQSGFVPTAQTAPQLRQHIDQEQLQNQKQQMQQQQQQQMLQQQLNGSRVSCSSKNHSVSSGLGNFVSNSTPYTVSNSNITPAVPESSKVGNSMPHSMSALVTNNNVPSTNQNRAPNATINAKRGRGRGKKTVTNLLANCVNAKDYPRASQSMSQPAQQSGQSALQSGQTARHLLPQSTKHPAQQPLSLDTLANRPPAPIFSTSGARADAATNNVDRFPPYRVSRMQPGPRLDNNGDALNSYMMR